MPDLSTLIQPDRGQPARTIHLVDAKGFDAWLSAQPPRHRAAAAAQKLAPTGYSSAILPGDGPEEWSVVSVVANVDKLSPWCLAKLADTLPEGTYRIEDREPGRALHGWLAAQYKFDRYRKKDDKAQGPRVLLTSDPARIEEALRLAAVTFKLRDRINTGANDMGPADLESAAADLAKSYGATLSVAKGSEIAKGYGLIWAVGKAAGEGREPRLIELEWGNPEHPRVAIVGKGVCFDTGGLNIKSGDGMRHMKKDMGGAAHALGLAQLIMARKLPVRLQLLVAAVENAIGPDSYRPGEVITTRTGITVEIDNTDAEGRVILGDALAYAGEGKPDLLMDFATLTGAARVALGPDLPALFCNDEAIAAEYLAAGLRARDPLWRMPLWRPYAHYLKSNVADMANGSSSRMAGALSAALYLERFVPDGQAWTHVDVYAWNDFDRPGKPAGGEAQGLRAAFALLQDRYAASTS